MTGPYWVDSSAKIKPTTTQIYADSFFSLRSLRLCGSLFSFVGGEYNKGGKGAQTGLVRVRRALMTG